MSESSSNKGWQVVIAGTGINLALGVLYAWSIFKGAIVSSIKAGGPDAFKWSLASVNDPYALCCLCFAFSMIVAGKCQDKIGPARTALIGGILVGSGFTMMSFSNRPQQRLLLPAAIGQCTVRPSNVVNLLDIALPD